MDVDLEHCEENDTVDVSLGSSNFFNLYKNNDKVASSKAKRQLEISNNRKECRHSIFNSNRFNNDHKSLLDSKKTESRKIYYANIFEQLGRFLTLAKNFVSVSNDFGSDYLVKYCPVGTRVFIEARRSRTTLISIDGKVLHMFLSKLPGGYCNKRNNFGADNYSYLDGVYDETNRKLYILDVMRLGPKTLDDVPFMSRCQLLESYVRPELADPNFQSDVAIHVVSAMSFDRNTLQNALSGNNSFPVDGIVLYKKYEGYQSGPSSSLTWVDCAHIPQLLSLDTLPVSSEAILMEIDPAEMEHKHVFKSPF